MTVDLNAKERGPITWRGVMPCKWFAMCPNNATGTTSHPVLGDVPSCDRCHELAQGKD